MGGLIGSLFEVFVIGPLAMVVFGLFLLALHADKRTWWEILLSLPLLFKIPVFGCFALLCALFALCALSCMYVFGRCVITEVAGLTYSDETWLEHAMTGIVSVIIGGGAAYAVLFLFCLVVITGFKYVLPSILRIIFAV